MNELRACLSVSGVFLLAALFGAAPSAHAQDASRATPPPGKVLVFVFRSDRQPVAAQVPVTVNLVRIGDLANGTFAVATVNPGRTFLRIGEQAVAVFTLEDSAGGVEVIAFPETYQRSAALIEAGTLVLVRGKLERGEESVRILAAGVLPIDSVRERTPGEVALRVRMPADRGPL